MVNHFFLHHQLNSILNHIVYNNIKDGGRDEISLGCSPSCLEVGVMVPILPGNDLLPLPKFFREPLHMWPSAVALQVHQKTAPVHSVSGFAEVQKTQEDWFLIDARQILSKLELQDGCPHSPTHTEAM